MNNVGVCMRAKEYARQFLESEDDTEIVTIANQFIREIGAIGKMRGIKSDYAMMAIITELDLKWKAFAKIVNKRLNLSAIKSDGFADSMQQVFPDIYDCWKTSKRG